MRTGNFSLGGSTLIHSGYAGSPVLVGGCLTLNTAPTVIIDPTFQSTSIVLFRGTCIDNPTFSNVDVTTTPEDCRNVINPTIARAVSPIGITLSLDFDYDRSDCSTPSDSPSLQYLASYSFVALACLLPAFIV